MALSAQSQTFHGSGSRDLYPDNTGGRFYMYSSTGRASNTIVAFPFPMLGEHFVYAKVGEVIAIGSSAMGYGNGGVRVTSPTGNVTTYTGNPLGRIGARINELAGPRLPGGGGNTYVPYEISVGTGQAGVWKVEFLPVAPSNTTVAPYSPPTTNAGTWTQHQTATNSATNDNTLIAAWDVSVRSNASGSWTWVPGRTYTNLLHLFLRPDDNYSETYGFNGKVFVLTKDGYVYRVNNNGNHGVGFVFFANNNGFINKTTNEPLYASVNTSTDVIDFVHNPIIADANGNITNKMFYSFPAADLPATSTINGYGGTSWLRVPRIPPAVFDVKIIGYDGTEGQVSNKGGHFYFETDNLASRYTIVISPPVGQPGLFASRTLTGPAQEGENWVPWDGKDGNGNDLPPGIYGPQVGVSLQTAETHFPYIDMEINPKGIIIELMKDDGTGVEAGMDKVYWNDTGIDNATGVVPLKPSPTNASHTTIPAGTSSNSNGHRWGQYGATTSSGNNGRGDNGFGNEKSIDTWTFVQGETQSFTPQIFVAQADVETMSIVSSHTGVVSVGDSWDYTVQVRNNGDMDIKTNTDPLAGLLTGPATFMLYVPPGITLDPLQVTFSSTSCLDEGGNPASIQIQGTPTFFNGVYSAEIDMPKGCIATFTIPVTAIGGVLTGNGNINTWATMLRPDDFTDINATNPYPNKKPTDPFFEADGIEIPIEDIDDPLTPGVDHPGMGNTIFLDPGSISLAQTNNVKLNNQPYMLADVEITKTGSRTADNGGTATFILTVRNNGPSIAHNVTVTDTLTSRYTYSGINSPSQGSVFFSSPTLTWNVGTLAVNGTATLTFTTSNNANGDRTNTAEVTADEFDNNLDNNSSTISQPVNTGAAIDLGVTKSVDNATPNVGALVTFTINISRVSGADPVNNVVVTDVLPSGYAYTSHNATQGTYTPGNGTWNVGTIAGTVQTLTLSAFVKPPTGTSGEYLNVASITAASRADNNLTNNTASASVSPQVVDLSITKDIDDTTPDEGQEIEFVLTVTNHGPADATGVEVFDKLPDGYEFVDKNASSGSYDELTGIWTIGSLNNDSSVTLTITAIVKGAGQYINSAEVSGSLQETNYTNNSAQVIVLPTCEIRNVSPKLTIVP